MHDRMINMGDTYTQRSVVFLGPTLRQSPLPEAWHAWSPHNLDEDQILFILTAEDILVIGTVKKIDDLRRRCQAYIVGATSKCAVGALVFQNVLHDEFARQFWLDLYSVAKVCAPDGTYTAYGDPNQTKAHIEADVWQHPDQSCEESMAGFRAAVSIQRDTWEEYVRFQKGLNKPAARTLKSKLEGSEALVVNRRSHPAIVSMFSRAYYDNRMKPSEEFTEPSFVFPALECRVIFVHCSSPTVAPKTGQTSYRNDTELRATSEVADALMSYGVPPSEIMLLSAYSLHAHRMGGRTVASAQGCENTVVIYNGVSYGMASDTSGKLSLRGDVFNTAGTRARSLLLVVADAQKIIATVRADSGLRLIMSWSPIIPLEHFLATLPNVAELNQVCATTCAPKRPLQAKADMKLAKKANKRKHPTGFSSGDL